MAKNSPLKLGTVYEIHIFLSRQNEKGVYVGDMGSGMKGFVLGKVLRLEGPCEYEMLYIESKSIELDEEIVNTYPDYVARGNLDESGGEQHLRASEYRTIDRLCRDMFK